MRAETGMSLGAITPSLRGQTRRAQITRLHCYETSRIGRCTEAESRLVVSRSSQGRDLGNNSLFQPGWFSLINSGVWDMDVSLRGPLLNPLQVVIEFRKMLGPLPTTDHSEETQAPLGCGRAPLRRLRRK